MVSLVFFQRIAASPVSRNSSVDSRLVMISTRSSKEKKACTDLASFFGQWQDVAALLCYVDLKSRTKKEERVGWTGCHDCQMEDCYLDWELYVWSVPRCCRRAALKISD